MRTVMKFDSLLADSHLQLQQPQVPISLQALRKHGIILQIKGAHTDVPGIVPWRVAFYIAGNYDALLNGLQLLDTFLAW